LLQAEFGFEPRTIMPICLPPNDEFRDNPRQAKVVGVGLKKDKDNKCMTDVNGPDIFAPCAPTFYQLLPNGDRHSIL
jgi:hypothetical protein